MAIKTNVPSVYRIAASALAVGAAHFLAASSCRMLGSAVLCTCDDPPRSVAKGSRPANADMHADMLSVVTHPASVARLMPIRPSTQWLRHES